MKTRTRTTLLLLSTLSLSLSALAVPSHHASNHLERRMRIIPRAAPTKNPADPSPSAAAMTPISGPDAAVASAPSSSGKKGAQSNDSVSSSSSTGSAAMDPTPTFAFAALPATNATSTIVNGTVVAVAAAASSTGTTSVTSNVLSAFRSGSPYFALAVFVACAFGFVSILIMIGIGKWFAHRPQFADPADYPEGLPTRSNTRTRNKIRPQSSTWITPAYGLVKSGSDSSGSDEPIDRRRGGRGEVDESIAMSEKRWKEEEREHILPKARRSSTVGRNQKGRSKVLKAGLPRIPEMAHKRSGSGSSSEGEFEFEERRRSYSSNFSASSFGGLSNVLGGYRTTGQHSYPASLRPSTPDAQSMHTISSNHPSSLRPSTPANVDADLLGPSFIPISLRPTSPAFSVGSNTTRGPSPAPSYSSDHTFSTTPFALRRQLPTPPTDPSPPSRGPSPRPLPRPSLSNPSSKSRSKLSTPAAPKTRAHFLDPTTDDHSDSGTGSGSWSSASDDAQVIRLERGSEKVYRAESNVPAAGRKTTKHHNHTRRQSRRPSAVPSGGGGGGAGRVHEPYSWQGPIERSLPPPEVGGELEREEWRGVGEFARR